MNEEEKKAIEELKKEIDKPLEENETCTDTFILCDIKKTKTILNLIEKQQKEIGRLKQNTMLLAKELDERDEEIKNLEEEIELGNALSISKDKIRDKIKELEILKITSFANNEISKQVYKEHIDLINMQINVLKSLLEEEK